MATGDQCQAERKVADEYLRAKLRAGLFAT